MPVKRVELIRIIQIFSLTFIVTYSTVAFAYDPFDCLDDVAREDSKITMGLAVRLCSGDSFGLPATSGLEFIVGRACMIRAWLYPPLSSQSLDTGLTGG